MGNPHRTYRPLTSHNVNSAKWVSQKTRPVTWPVTGPYVTHPASKTSEPISLAGMSVREARRRIVETTAASPETACWE